ncbi:MAG: tetratricopeptide repeat protein [Bacteroidia bacterium]
MNISKKIFLYASALLISVSACKQNSKTSSTTAPDKDTCIAQIKKYEIQMKGETQLDNATAVKAIQAYTDFAFAFPNDSNAADCLFKAGEVSTAIGKYPQALSYYQTITGKYPTYKLIVESVFLQGYIYDSFLKDTAKAHIFYQEVITKYPNATFAQDAKAAIQNLGKSDDELVKEFEAKDQKEIKADSKK